MAAQLEMEEFKRVMTVSRIENDASAVDQISYRNEEAVPEYGMRGRQADVHGGNVLAKRSTLHADRPRCASPASGRPVRCKLLIDAIAT